MIIEGQSEQYLCADGKFFVMYDHDEVGNPLYRQIERYLPANADLREGGKGEMIKSWLAKLEEGDDWRWAIGSTGGQLTARYQIRESDGQLVSLLSLKGGMQ